MVIGGLANPAGDDFEEGVGAGVGDRDDAGRVSGVSDPASYPDEDVLVGWGTVVEAIVLGRSPEGSTVVVTTVGLGFANTVL